MDPIATYQCEADGWRWVFKLFHDRLTAIGTKGTDRQSLQMELRHSCDIPDQGETTIQLRHPKYHWILAGGIAIAVVCFAFGNAVMFALDLSIGHPEHFPAFAISWTVVVYMAYAWIIPAFLKKQMKQRFATFRSAANGVPLLTLHAVLDPDDVSFETFVDEIIAAIRKQRDARDKAVRPAVQPTAPNGRPDNDKGISCKK